MAATAFVSGRCVSGGRGTIFCQGLFDVRTTALAGRILFAVSLVSFGIQHFMYHNYIASLIPGLDSGAPVLGLFYGRGFPRGRAEHRVGQSDAPGRHPCWRQCFSSGSRYFMGLEWPTLSTTGMSGLACSWPCSWAELDSYSRELPRKASIRPSITERPMMISFYDIIVSEQTPAREKTDRGAVVPMQRFLTEAGVRMEGKS